MMGVPLDFIVFFEFSHFSSTSLLLYRSNISCYKRGNDPAYLKTNYSAPYEDVDESLKRDVEPKDAGMEESRLQDSLHSIFKPTGHCNECDSQIAFTFEEQ